MRQTFAAVLICLMLALAGCATPQAPASHDLNAFSRQGRFAVLARQPGNERVDSVQGGFVWQENGPLVEIDLTSALGSTLARVTVRPTGATLTQSNGQVQQAANADILVEEVLGQPLPVSDLRQWLHGRAAGKAVTNVVRDDQGRLSEIAENAWRVELSRYDSLGPRLLVLHREQAGRFFTVRLIVD